MRHDRRLLRYDTLIIDEAHERSLNVDFILGYLHRLLPSRPDLKVIITSATIDPERFSVHFAGGESKGQSAGGESEKHSGGAPIIEVSGRTYPVQVRYRPLVPDAAGTEQSIPAAEPRDQVQAIADAIAELRPEGPGDILVFLSGEREIRDTADALTGDGYADLDVLPLYGRLSAAEQHRVFAGGERGKQGEAHRRRRVVLATNVAETSLTVPGIKYVIDAGTARISRYSNRTKVQRLPIEPVSQASANQRAGRCAREVLIIAAALSIQDPRERPADAREAADAQHARFAEPGSDFLSLLNLWDYLGEQQRELSGSAFRRMCRREYLHYLRVREWQDVYGQLRQAARELGIPVGPDRTARRPAQPAGGPGKAAGGPSAHLAPHSANPAAVTQPPVPADLADRVHQSLLAGLLSHIGMRDVAK